MTTGNGEVIPSSEIPGCMVKFTAAMSAIGTKRTIKPYSRLSAIGPERTLAGFGLRRFVRCDTETVINAGQAVAAGVKAKASTVANN
jgi:hypothetical protein